jgi:DNA-binding transcriptional ArsR family regulator
MDQLDAVFGALADPTRRAILARLAEGDRTVS